VPIADSLLGLLIHANTRQLRQGDGKRSAAPMDHDEHLVLAFVFGRHLFDFDLVTGA
jgi:hypothetical protein